MDKLDSLQKIIDQLDVISYIAESATVFRIGDFDIVQEDSIWRLFGKNINKIFNTRMAAIGYARCCENNNQICMMQIEKLDQEIGGSFVQLESISNASKTNSQISPKVQQAEIKHRENMQELADLILHVL